VSSLFDVLTLQPTYNTSMVLAGTTLLGIGAGCVGVLMYLRKRALVSDAVAHATLPGVALGFLVALAAGWNDGRHLPSLLIGAGLTGFIGILCINFIKDNTRLTEDTAIGTVLSFFFALGIVLLSYIQSLGAGARAGLDSFLLGQTASLNMDEARLIAALSVLVILLTCIFLKELYLVCFDPDFAKSTGLPLEKLDIYLMFLMLLILCIGLKTVGLILIIALLIIPSVSARLWTNNIKKMIFISSVFGGLSCIAGTITSSLINDMPTGSVIVLSSFILFLFSLLLSPNKGLIGKALNSRRR
jgi:manganese/zinc/iron transport system permease protein